MKFKQQGQKIIKEVIGVPCKEEECAEEDNSSKIKTLKGSDILMLHRKQYLNHQQHQMILKKGGKRIAFNRCL